jgi:DegV family protein with EDD domain
VPVHIVTDSTSDLPAELAAQYGIHVVPLLIYFGAEEFRDGVDLDTSTFYEKLEAAREMPRTSQPPVDAFQSMYRELLGGDDDYVLSIHVSAKLSGTLNSAHSARGLLGELSSRVAILDARSVSAGVGAVALMAARTAATGASLSEVQAAAERTRDRVKLFALVDRLDYLQKGGRIGKAASLVGSMLKINPLLSVEDGEVVPYARVRTHAKAIERLLQLALEQDAEMILVGYGTNAAEAEEFAGHIRSEKPGAEVIPFRIGPTVGVYTGPGVIGFVPVGKAT